MRWIVLSCTLLICTIYAALLHALLALPGRAWDQWHHAWFGLVALGGAILAAGIVLGGAYLFCAVFVLSACGLCALDDAIKHSLQAWKYRRATTDEGRAAALRYECGLHVLAQRLGVI